MFTEEFRREVRDHLLRRADRDERLTGVALTGSSSVGAEDRWSDIDLAFGMNTDCDIDQVIADWTQHVSEKFEVVDHLDIHNRETLYRVFLLSNTLQVDIAFAPEAEFGPLAPTFQLMSGTAGAQPPPTPFDEDRQIGMAWLYALHARSSIARGKYWQAEYMISSLRNQVVMLACNRSNLPATQGRGVDKLPSSMRTSLEGTLVRTPDDSDLIRAFGNAAHLLSREIAMRSKQRAQTINPVLVELVRTAADPGSL